MGVLGQGSDVGVVGHVDGDTESGAEKTGQRYLVPVEMSGATNGAVGVDQPRCGHPHPDHV
jgi:hypothetical protein